MARIYEGSASSTRMVRQAALSAGIFLLMLGVGGLLLGEGVWNGLFNIDLAEDIIHIGSALLLGYAALGQKNLGLTKTIMGVLGVVYLLLGVLGMVDSRIFGLIPGGLTMFDHLLHFALAIIFLVFGFVVGRKS